MSTPEGLPSVSGHRYEGYRLEQKYGWMQHRRGPAAVTGGTDLLRALAKDYADSEQAIRAELDRLGVNWEGTAAEAVAAALSRAADWAQGAAATSAAGGSGISAYGDSFASSSPRSRHRSRRAGPPAGARRPTASAARPPATSVRSPDCSPTTEGASPSTSDWTGRPTTRSTRTSRTAAPRWRPFRSRTTPGW